MRLPISVYPYKNIEDYNLDYLQKKVDELKTILENFISLNSIKYANPIQWNITKQYEANTVVIDANDGTAYLSVKPVPTGVAITNTDYWTPIFTLNLLSANQNITLRDDGANVLATFASVKGDWLIWNNTLYRVTRAINANEAYVVGYNLERFSVELFIKEYINNVIAMIGNLNDLDTTDKTDIVSALNEVLTTSNNLVGNLSNLDTTDKTNVVSAINEVLETMSNLVGSLNNLTTTNKTNVVSAINEVLKTCNIDWVTPQMFGALGDGVHDDTSAIQQAINTRKLVYFPQGIYRTTASLTLLVGTHLMGKMNNQAHGNTHGATIMRDGNGNCIVINASTPCIIENLLIDKVNSVNNGIGIDITNTDNFQLKNVRVINYQTGISVNGCSFGEISHCVCERNYGDGFYFTSNSTLGVCQVQVESCLSELNDGVGFHYVTRVPSMPVGMFSNNMTFANTRGGVVYERVDASAYITGIKICGCFIGSDDQLGGVYIGCTNYPVLIDHCYFEEAGMTVTGRSYNTPASYNANAITLFQATKGAMISNCAICTSAMSGIACSSGSSISNCNFEQNGIAPNVTAIQQCDIHIVAGFQTIMNNMFMSSANGIYKSGGADAIITGNIFNNTKAFAGNTVAKIKTNIGLADN